MKNDEFKLKASDGLLLFAQSWETDKQPKAMICLVHGLGEHSGRYFHVADRLTRAGYAFIAFDLRGHGKSSGERGHISSYNIFMQDISAVLTLAKLMSPMTPHLSEDIWARHGQDGLIAASPWPEADESMLVSDTITLPIQVNGKRRAEITVPADMGKEDVEKAALADAAIVRTLDGSTPKKVIVVPGRIVNVVV